MYLDTHSVEALRNAKLGPFSRETRRLMEREAEFRVSPIVLLELDYLRELGRIRSGGREALATLRTSVGLKVCRLSFEDVALQAASESWTRDPFDRIIVAQARLAKAPLVTRDGDILAHYNRAVS